MASGTKIEIPVVGMTCDHCVGTVRRALEGIPGVQSAAVDLQAGRAEVTLDPDRVDRPRLKAAVEGAGYSVPDEGGAAPQQLVTIGAPIPSPSPTPPPEEWELAIGGMHCASCVARVEKALTGVVGVGEARVNLATERARVAIDPARVSAEALAEAVARAGYSARRMEEDPSAGAEAMRRERAEQVAYWRNRLLVGVALTVPLVVLGYGPMLSSSHAWHAPWVGWTMFALAAVLQIYLGGPYLRGAWDRLRQGSSNMDTLIALGTSTAFGYSLYGLLSGPEGRVTPGMAVVGVAMFLAVSLVGALVFGRGGVPQHGMVHHH